MFSRLDPLFKTQMRHAETLDTRQGIRRQEKAKSKNKGDNEQAADDEDDLWEDHTTVSVLALKSFLEQLAGETQIKEQGGSKENIAISEKAQQADKKNTDHKKASPSAARAASAYQRTYHATHRDEMRDVPASSIPSIELRPEEIRTIHQLIDDFNKLLSRNIHELTIHKSESFLQSLVNAVKRLN